jgi:hypothetical protein
MCLYKDTASQNCHNILSGMGCLFFGMDCNLSCEIWGSDGDDNEYMFWAMTLCSLVEQVYTVSYDRRLGYVWLCFAWYLCSSHLLDVFLCLGSLPVIICELSTESRRNGLTESFNILARNVSVSLFCIMSPWVAVTEETGAALRLCYSELCGEKEEHHRWQLVSPV